MKIYWRIYSVLALTTLAALLLISWIAFSLLPGYMERRREEILDGFQEEIATLEPLERTEIETLADSMGVVIRFVRSDHAANMPPNQPMPPQAHPPPGEQEWRGVRLIQLEGTPFSMLASVRSNAPRFLLFVVLILAIFVSQAIALALGLKPLFRRTEILTRATGQFGRGQLNSRYPDHGGSDEIDVLGRSFNTMADRILTLLDSHNELLNAVAHELRTPMARLSFALELARSNPETVREKLGLMEKDLFELDKLVTELLEFNRIKGTDSACSSVSVLEVCHQAADSERVHNPRINITVTPFEGDPDVSGDARLLLRAVSNLVRNAVCHAESKVVVTLNRTPQNLIISVRDDGQGFPSNLLGRLLNPFVKGEKSTGTGLGLSIVQRIAEKHGGEIKLSNAPDGGAVAEIIIPSG